MLIRRFEICTSCTMFVTRYEACLAKQTLYENNTVPYGNRLCTSITISCDDGGYVQHTECHVVARTNSTTRNMHNTMVDAMYEYARGGSVYGLRPATMLRVRIRATDCRVRSCGAEAEERTPDERILLHFSTYDPTITTRRTWPVSGSR